MNLSIKAVLFFIWVAANSSCSQQSRIMNADSGIPDTTYKNVVEIQDRNVVSDGINFLFDYPIPAKSTHPVLFISSKIPSDLLDGLYPEFQRLTIITPNWKFYAEHKGSRTGEPIASSVIYNLNRENEKLVKDSLVIMGGFPKMNIIAAGEEATTLKVYFTEQYGSICCPRDAKWDLKPSLKEFVADFELKNKVKIKDSYLENAGEEGEVNYYYTLNGLSDKLRLQFIVERTVQTRNMKAADFKAKIYTPTEVNLSNRLKKLRD